MGLNLRNLLHPATISLDELAGERLAIDAYGLFYQYLTMLRDKQGHTLRDAHGNTTSHLVGLVSRTEQLVAAGVTPAYVLDGPPHPLKENTIAKRVAAKNEATGRLEQARMDGDMDMIRKSAAATTRVTRNDAENAALLLKVCGIPVIQAPADAEAQCAALAAAGNVQAAASQDYDTLIFGAPRIVRNLTNTRRGLEEILLAAFLIEHRLDRETLVDLACIVGNDFFPGIHGLGSKGALRLLDRHGSLERILERAENGTPPADHAERRVQTALKKIDTNMLQEVRNVFLNPPHDPQARVEPGAPDAAGIHERLVEIHGMSRARADQFAVALIDHHEGQGRQNGRGKPKNPGNEARPERPLPLAG